MENLRKFVKANLPRLCVDFYDFYVTGEMESNSLIREAIDLLDGTYHVDFARKIVEDFVKVEAFKFVVNNSSKETI